MKILTIGIVNCNRLFYLQSQIASLLLTAKKQLSQIQLIIIDNASTELGTEEYLNSIQTLENIDKLFELKIIKQPTRDPNNEFAIALNTIRELSTGDVIMPMQGDSQFVRHNWVNDVLSVASNNDCGCIILDAQRKVTNKKSKFVDAHKKAFIDLTRSPIAGAGDVAYSKDVLMQMGNWATVNESHEVRGDSETKMLNHIIDSGLGINKVCYVLKIPALITINTDPRGTNARVRHNKRYGQYWQAKSNDLYYDLILDVSKFDITLEPVSIEDLAKPNGWIAPLSKDGHWLKNPIRPETATTDDYVEL